MAIKLSIAVPIHEMPNKDFFLARLQDSLEKQSFHDFEIVMTKDGEMAENTNSAIKKSKGELIKILYMDDYLYDENSLQDIVDNFKEEDNWLVTGCVHDDGRKLFSAHYPEWNDEIYIKNTIGSPSVLTIKNDSPLLFDENLSWMLDAELYKRYYDKFGLPKILNTVNVVIGIGDHQMTNVLSPERKQEEYEYSRNKYEKK